MSATSPKASGLPRPVKSVTALSRVARVRPITATRAPSSARQRAVAKPMPRLPPTTAVVAFASPRSMVSSRIYQKAYDRYYSSRWKTARISTGTGQILMEVPVVAKQATADKRQRRERGSINPDDIISGAFELAEQVSIDNLSMPLLGKHLGVGVTSIYWYFRKKDDLLNAMTDRALRKYVFATPYVEAGNWRESLRNHARMMRKTFLSSPILTDLILIRGALSSKARRLGVEQMERAI